MELITDNVTIVDQMVFDDFINFNHIKVDRTSHSTRVTLKIDDSLGSVVNRPRHYVRNFPKYQKLMGNKSARGHRYSNIVMKYLPELADVTKMCQTLIIINERGTGGVFYSFCVGRHDHEGYLYELSRSLHGELRSMELDKDEIIVDKMILDQYTNIHKLTFSLK